MSFRTDEIKTYRTIVICDDCGKEKVITDSDIPLGFNNRMNGALQNGYMFKQEGSVFKNYCFQCESKRRERQVMTQVKDKTDQQLNRALSELMGYTIKELPIGSNGRQLYALVTPLGRERLSAYTVESTYLDAPDYCTNPAASLEVQAKAIEVSAEKYVQALQISTSVCAVMQNSRKDIAVLLTASPRERAEAAYITLKGEKGNE